MLKDKIILITGASSGIGAEISFYAARYGAFVYIGYNSGKERAEEIQKQILENSGKAQIINIDVCNQETIDTTIKEIINSHGKIDCLINSAGINPIGSLASSNIEKIQKQIDVNLMGTIRVTKAVIPFMQKQNSGSILQISSVLAHRMLRGHSIYSATKAGIEGFSKALASEVAKYSIRVNCLVLGPVKTPMLEKSMRFTKDDLSSKVPMNRLIETDEVAETACFILSDKASAITGSLIPVDCGYMLL